MFHNVPFREIAGPSPRGPYPSLALLGTREMSDLSPQSGPKRTLDQVAVTNRDRSLLTETSLRRMQYFLENSISEDKNNCYGRVHCNDEPKQNTSLSTQPLYFISGLPEFL